MVHPHSTGQHSSEIKRQINPGSDSTTLRGGISLNKVLIPRLFQKSNKLWLSALTNPEAKVCIKQKGQSLSRWVISQNAKYKCYCCTLCQQHFQYTNNSRSFKKHSRSFKGSWSNSYFLTPRIAYPDRLQKYNLLSVRQNPSDPCPRQSSVQ